MCKPVLKHCKTSRFLKGAFYFYYSPARTNTQPNPNQYWKDEVSWPTPVSSAGLESVGADLRSLELLQVAQDWSQDRPQVLDPGPNPTHPLPAHGPVHNPP